MNLFEHRISTHSDQQMTKVTSLVREDIEKSGVKEGIVVVYSPHTTAGFTINENADPDVVHDMLYGYEKAIPTYDREYRHIEGNSHAHMKTSLVGPSQTLIISGGELVLGIWQDLYFCEFDGPRNRRFYVKIMEGVMPLHFSLKYYIKIRSLHLQGSAPLHHMHLRQQVLQRKSLQCPQVRFSQHQCLLRFRSSFLPYCEGNQMHRWIS